MGKVYYRPPTKLRQSNVFSRVCLFTEGGRGSHNAMDFTVQSPAPHMGPHSPYRASSDMKPHCTAPPRHETPLYMVPPLDMGPHCTASPHPRHQTPTPQAPSDMKPHCTDPPGHGTYCTRPPRTDIWWLWSDAWAMGSTHPTGILSCVIQFIRSCNFHIFMLLRIFCSIFFKS